MKIILTLTIIALLIAGCAPSAKSIELAIAKTQTAAPSLTPSPSPTSTQMPTPTKLKPVSECVLRNGDLLHLADKFSQYPVLTKEVDNLYETQDQVNGHFYGKSGGLDLYFKVTVFNTPDDARSFGLLQMSYVMNKGRIYDLTESEIDNMWAGKINTFTVTGFYIKNVEARIYLGAGGTSTDLIKINEQLGIQLIRRLQACGYAK